MKNWPKRLKSKLAPLLGEGSRKKKDILKQPYKKPFLAVFMSCKTISLTV